MSAPKPGFISLEDQAILQKGKRMASAGTLRFEDIDTNRCWSLLDLKCFYCISRAEINPPCVEIGKVGHSNSWKDVPFSFIVKNPSDIPFCYVLEMPEAIELVDKGPERIRNIPAHSSLTIGCILIPKLLGGRQAGPLNMNVMIKNSNNPNNTLTLDVKAHLSVLELRVERLVNDELLLPPLNHPLLPESSCSDNW